MRRIVFSMFFAMLAIISLAGRYSAKTLPLPANNVENPSYVSNPDGILSVATVDSINVLLRQLDHDKGVKTLVIVVERLDPDDPYEFSMEVGRLYGVGSKQNTGLIVTLATLDRSYEILTGEGMDKFLPDIICHRIEERSMVPLLKEKKWNEAVLAGIKDIHRMLSNEKELDAELQRLAEEQEEERRAAIIGGIIFALLVLGFVALIWYIDYKSRYCKICEQHKMKMQKRSCVRINKNQMKVTEIWYCPHCHNTETRERIANTGEQYERAIFLGGASRGGGFGSSGGGGWRGGSFGGGSFGGGGAGGRF